MGETGKKSARKSILVVEDDRALRQFYQDALEDDYDIFVASSGEDALQRLNVSGNVDLVVLDLRLPGMSGIAVLHEMKRSFPAVPVIIVSACKVKKIKSELSAIGLYEYMEKPFSVGRLLDRIKAHTNTNG